MTTPCQSACSPWTDIDSVLACEHCPDDADADILDESIVVASDILFELSGHKYAGSCRDIVRPCSQGGGYPFQTIRGSAQEIQMWGGLCGCNQGPRCSCLRLSEIYLGAYPLTSIVSVKQDGATLPPSAYQIHDFERLVRVDGERWPCCQRLDLPSTEPDTFEVEFTYGTPPPPLGRRAAAEFACQLYLACTDTTSGTCQLDPRVTQVARQGISLVFFDTTLFASGLTGLRIPDLFLTSVGVNRQGQAHIYSPDVTPAVRRITG